MSLSCSHDGVYTAALVSLRVAGQNKCDRVNKGGQMERRKILKVNKGVMQISVPLLRWEKGFRDEHSVNSWHKVMTGR
ncbi:hypothetical protein KUV56_02825 [Ferrimonas balearica]|uniref:hypothetical protein n=1 Tax=Ferrimonas balearica TaxID=44012 RepID=UPI001C55F9D4|nr:hypothetical protein [Ferrimonas balearica]MBW3138461.1 hypothetical protein [Ferrimonas balearica]